MAALGVYFSRTKPSLAIILIVAVLLDVGCSAENPSTPSAPPIVQPQLEVAADVWADRGLVVRQDSFATPLDDPQSVIGESWRAVYNSVSGVDGGIRQVSGAFFIPRGSPPDNGWPVVSFAHGTTGIDNACGPSTEPDLMGYLPLIRDFLGEGYAVAFSDYEGLGEPGSHPFLEPRTAAFNITDAVRALRETSAAVSPRWLAFGSSQGGEATWAADELNSYYGDGLDLLGSVALSPAANASGLADLAWAGSLTKEQQTYFPLVTAGLARYNPDVNVRNYIHGQTAANMGVLASCESPVNDSQSRTQTAKDLKPDTLENVDRLRDALRRIALPQHQLDKPMLVVNGMQDETILPQWVATAVSGSCDLGGRILHLEISDADHENLTPEADAKVRSWIADRFAGTAAPSNCPAVSQEQR